jgi:REP-associated tyrosine transposase
VPGTVRVKRARPSFHRLGLAVCSRATFDEVTRVPRSSLPDGFFHVISRGVPAAGHIFRDDDDRTTLFDLIWRSARDHRWKCHAVCVLGSHYHLVVEAAQPHLSAGMQQVNWRYARHFNQKHESFGHVFAERFTSRVIESESYLYDACVYVLLNPVKAGLCRRVEEWPCSYSSFGLLAA